jgi:hypothetical protein
MRIRNTDSNNKKVCCITWLALTGEQTTRSVISVRSLVVSTKSNLAVKGNALKFVEVITALSTITLKIEPESYYHCPNAHYTNFLNINVPNINLACTNAQFKKIVSGKLLLCY